MGKSNKELQDENKELVEVLEKVDRAYNQSGLQQKYTKEMRSALISLKIFLLKKYANQVTFKQKQKEMEDLLKQYIQKENNWDYIYITYWEIKGATCEVDFYTDESKQLLEKSFINIWDMIVFLNDNE